MSGLHGDSPLHGRACARPASARRPRHIRWYYQSGTRLQPTDAQQADQDARTRMAMEFAYYYGWGPGWYGPYGDPGLYPYARYTWYPDGSGWYGGIGTGF